MVDASCGEDKFGKQGIDPKCDCGDMISDTKMRQDRRRICCGAHNWTWSRQWRHVLGMIIATGQALVTDMIRHWIDGVHGTLLGLHADKSLKTGE